MSKKRKWEYGVMFRGGTVYFDENPMSRKRAKSYMLKGDRLVRRRTTEWKIVPKP